MDDRAFVTRVFKGAIVAVSAPVALYGAVVAWLSVVAPLGAPPPSKLEDAKGSAIQMQAAAAIARLHQAQQLPGLAARYRDREVEWRMVLINVALAPGDAMAYRAALEDADRAIRSALARKPASAWLWFNLAEVETRLAGFNDNAIRYVSLSYRYGSAEAWLMVRRAPFLLRYWRLLTPDLREKLLSELSALLPTPHDLVTADIARSASIGGGEALAAVREIVRRNPQFAQHFERLLTSERQKWATQN